jgi:hypothetical protein
MPPEADPRRLDRAPVIFGRMELRADLANAAGAVHDVPKRDVLTEVQRHRLL